jgi:hypothetical protein
MLRCTVLACLLAVANTAVEAQTPLHVALAGGWTFPVAPTGVTDLWNGSVAIAAQLSWRATARTAPWIEIGYYRQAFDHEVLESTIRRIYPNVTVSGNDLQVVPVLVGVDVALTGWGNTRPYAAVGLGYDHIALTKPQASGPGADTVRFPDPGDDAFGARIGLGVRTLVTPAVTLFVDASYHVAWTSPEALGFVPVRVGLRF